MLYTSIDNKYIKRLKKLNTKKYRDEYKEFLIEGEHLVKEAYKKGYLKELILCEDNPFKLDIDTKYVSLSVMNYISELSSPSTIIGVCNKLECEDIGNKILVLDGIQDPGNLGTIIRSSVAFGIDTIILSKDTVDLYNSKVIRATQGMIFNINIIEKDLLTFLPTLKGYKIFGTKVDGGKDLKNVEKLEKFVIIVGNEGNGVKKEILDLCDEYIYICMNSSCESLNVGVATSIILYELNK